jgi:hypothetical protein
MGEIATHKKPKTILLAITRLDTEEALFFNTNKIR